MRRRMREDSCECCGRQLSTDDSENFCQECEDRYPFHLLQACVEEPTEDRRLYLVTLRDGGYEFDRAVMGSLRGKGDGTILSQWIQLYKGNKLVACISEDCIESTCDA